MSIGGELPSGCCPEPDYGLIVAALETGMEAIVEVLTAIDDTLQEQIDSESGILSAVLAEISSILNTAIAPLQGEVEAVQAELQSMIVEDIIQNQEIFDLQTLLYEGGLGQFPFPPTPPPKKTYYGYCDYAGGEVLVTDSPEPPFPTYTQVSFGDDEQVVYDEALNICKTFTSEAEESPLEPQPAEQATSFTSQCLVGIFSVAGNRQSIIGQATGVYSVSSWTEGMNAIARFGLEGINLGNIGQVMAAVTRGVSNKAPYVASLVVPALAKSLGCNTENWSNGMQAIAAIGLTKEITGVDFMPWATSLEYALNAECRRKFLSPDKATEVFLAGHPDMGLDSLDAHYAIEGLCQGQSTLAVHALKEKASSGELLEMLHRRVINYDGYASGMRQIGYIDTDVVSGIYNISVHQADIGSIVRMTANSALHDDVAGHFQLDAGYDEFFAGIYRSWIEGQGITEVEAKNVWRSHWSTPSIQTMYEIYHRLRDTDEFGTGEQAVSDMRSALTSQNISPYWQDRIIALKEYPLLKRDIRVAYNRGVLPDDDIDKAFRIVGHDEESTDTLVRELKITRRQEILSHVAIRNWLDQHINAGDCRGQLSADGFDDETIQQALTDSEHNFDRSTWADGYVRGLMPRDTFVQYLTEWGVSGNGAQVIASKLSFKIVDHQSVRNYLAGTMTRGEADQQMRNDGIESPIIDRIIRNADEQRNNVFATECARGIRTRQVMGELNPDEAVNALINAGIVDEYAHAITRSYECARKAEGKEIAVEKLCTWLYLGIIDQGEMYRRLIKMGYDDVNASLIIVDCVHNNVIKFAKQQQQIAKELQSQIDKENRAVDKVNADNRRVAERLARMRKQKADLRATRDKQLISAIEKVYKAVAGDLATVAAVVKAALGIAETQYHIKVDDALKIVLIAADNIKGSTLDAFTPLVSQLASVAENDGLEPSDADVAFVPSSNGNTQPSG